MPRKHKISPQKRRPAKASNNGQLEKLVLIVAIVEPLMTIPQILQIYVEHNTGTSMATWALYLLASAVWLAYGIKTRNVPIIVTDILWVVVEAIVVIGLLAY